VAVGILVILLRQGIFIEPHISQAEFVYLKSTTLYLNYYPVFKIFPLRGSSLNTNTKAKNHKV